MDLKMITLRIELIKESIRRSRAAFIAVTIASLSLLVAAWNAYLSSYRSFPLYVAQFSMGDATKTAQEELVERWVESQWITIGPLGIRIGISDAAVLGSIGLYIITIWMFFCVRRENRTVANLFYDMQSVADPLLKEFVQHAVAESMLFLSVHDDDEPLQSLKDVPRSGGKRSVLLRKSLAVLFYLPAITVGVVLALDVGSLFVIDAAFRDPHAPLFSGLMDGSMGLTGSEVAKLTAMTVAEVTLALMIFFVCQRIMAFEHATTQLIRENQTAPSRPSRE